MMLSIPVPAGWRNTTYHNDMMPSIEPIADDNIRIWVDDASCSNQRSELGEEGQYSRYILSVRDCDGQFADVCESNDFEAVMVAYNAMTYPFFQ